MKKHNFNAGPSILADEVIQNAAKAIVDFNGSGLSLLSISHRTKDFENVMAEADALFRELLGIPDNYKIFYIGGGASTFFYEVPANFLGRKAGYVNTGVWAKKAIKEAKRYGEVELLASSEDRNFTYIPKGFRDPRRPGLCAYHLQQYDLRHRVPRRPRFARAPDRRHVVGHPFPPGRCYEIRHDLRRCAEEPRPGRRGVRHHPRGHARPCRARPADDGCVPHPCRERLDVQHASRIPDLRAHGDPPLAQVDRRRTRNLPTQQGRRLPCCTTRSTATRCSAVRSTSRIAR